MDKILIVNKTDLNYEDLGYILDLILEDNDDLKKSNYYGILIEYHNILYKVEICKKKRYTEFLIIESEEK